MRQSKRFGGDGLRRILKITATAVIAAFLAFSPPWLLRGLQRDEYHAFFAKPAATWHGRIELWHIAGFRVYQGSVTDYLQSRADAYCKKHPGVHIDIVGLTETQYRERLDRGAFPDAYAFPPGYVYVEQLRALSLIPPTYLGNLAPSVQEDAVYAVPYLMSGYYLAGNAQLLTKYGFELPESADAAYLQAALDLSADTPQLSMPVIHAARLGLTGTLAEADAFKSGECMLAVLSARALGDILRGDAAPLLDAIPFPDYTDEVFYLGAAAGADDNQAAALSDFAAFLLSEKEQLRLPSLGALPVIATTEKPVYADEQLTDLYKAYIVPVTPDPFAYERHRAKLTDEALAALTGDAAAIAAFFQRLAVVENGNL